MNAAALPLPLPCPFCAATKGQTVMSREESAELDQLARLECVQRVAMVVCTGCGARGAVVAGTPAEAVEAWNRRDWKPC